MVTEMDDEKAVGKPSIFWICIGIFAVSIWVYIIFFAVPGVPARYVNDYDASYLEPLVEEYIELARNATRSDSDRSIAGPIVVVSDNPDEILHTTSSYIQERFLAVKPDEVDTIIFISDRGLVSAFKLDKTYENREIVAIRRSWSLKIVDKATQSVIHRERMLEMPPPEFIKGTDIERPNGTLSSNSNFKMVPFKESWGVVRKGSFVGSLTGDALNQFCNAGTEDKSVPNWRTNGIDLSRCWDTSKNGL